MVQNPKAKKEIFIILILLPILIILVLMNFSSPLSKHRSSPPVSSDSAKMAFQASPSPTQIQQHPQKTPSRFAKYEEKAWGRNPFRKDYVPSPPARPAPQQQRAIPVIHLQGIVWDEVFPYAVIDGEIRGVGDKIGYFEVIEITEDRVTLSDGERVLDLQLFPEMR